MTLPSQEVVVEGSYSFQVRLDYIDEEENPTSVYETKYGFFWINLEKKYVIIHSSENKILRAIKNAIEKATDTHLSALNIPKTLKNHLPFLQKESLKSGKLHDPGKRSENFRYLSFVDESPYEKGYENLEEKYPEVTDARYRTIIDDEKETSLKIKCNKAAISLAGKIKASQFRAWCIERLDELIRVIDAFKNDIPEYIQTRDLINTPELKKFSVKQREIVVLLVSKLLEIKHTKNSFESMSLEISSLELASKIGNLFHVQYEFEWPECSHEEGYLIRCPTCNSSEFIFKEKNSEKFLLCHPGISHKHFQFPIKLTCGNDHSYVLDIEEFLEKAELLPSSELLDIVAEIIKHHIPGFSFDKEVETFFVRENSFFYHKYISPEPTNNGSKNITLTNYNIIEKNEGEVSGINANQIKQ
jgi:hypothetical protein